MINLEAVKKFTELETELRRLNNLISNGILKKYMFKVDEAGKEFDSYLKNKGFQTSQKNDTRSSNQSKTFIAKYGRIEFSLTCNYSQYPRNEYWNLEITDDNYKKTRQIIDVQPNVQLENFDSIDSGSTEDKIVLFEKRIQSAKESHNKLQGLEYQLSLRKDYERDLSNTIDNISSLLDKQFK